MRARTSSEPIAEIRAGTMRRRGPGARLAVLYLAAILLVAAFLVFEDRPRHHELMGALYDLRHVLLLGFGGLLFLELTPLIGRRWIRKRSLYYAVATLIVILAAIRIELSHLPWETIRLFRNAVGGTGFLLLSAAFDRPLRREHAWLRGRPRQIIGALAILILVVVLRSLVPVTLDYAARSGEFPVVVDLKENWQERFVQLNDAMLFTGDPPPGWVERGNRKTTMISFGPVPEAGLTIAETYNDWRSFNTLRFQVYSEMDESIEIILRIDDQRGPATRDERFERSLTVAPGLNDFEIPFQDIRGGAEGRDIRMSRIRHIGIFSVGHAERFRLFLSSMRLVDRPGAP